MKVEVELDEEEAAIACLLRLCPRLVKVYDSVKHASGGSGQRAGSDGDC